MTTRIPLATVAAQWSRLGLLGFGGPPTHISLLRQLCVQRRGWIAADEFEDAIAATNLLPGPASTQLSIWCAWRVAGPVGGLLGGACFIAPGLVMILGLAALFLADDPHWWVQGIAAGAGAAVPAVAAQAAAALVPASRARAAARGGGRRVRWIGYLLAGAAAAIVTGPYLALVLVVAGLVEIAVQRPARPAKRPLTGAVPLAVLPIAGGGLAALAWVAFKVGALSYGGGFVIVPLMQADAVDRHHWMSPGEFAGAVALGQITPGPVVLTVAVVGYAAAGLLGALLATAVAFAPSFALVLGGARHFERLRANATVQAFLDGAGPTVIGAIAGSAVTLALTLSQLWQFAVLVAALAWLVGLRRGVVSALLGAGALGAVAALAHLPVSV